MYTLCSCYGDSVTRKRAPITSSVRRFVLLNNTNKKTTTAGLVLIKIVVAEQSDDIRWDKFVRSQASASPFLLSAWKYAIEQSYRHKSYYLIALHQDDIKGILPLFFLNPPIFKSTLCSLPFCDVGGTLTADASVEKALIQKALQLQKELGASGLEIRRAATWDNTFEEQPAGIQTAPKVQMYMPLPETSDALLKSFKSKLRSQIKKSEKNGLTFSFGRDTEHINAFYNVFALNMRKLGSPVHSELLFQNIAKCYQQNMLVGIIKMGEITCGAGILLFVNNRSTIPWASTISSYNQYAPNMLLYWNLLKLSCDLGYTQFDFGRSSFGEGTYRFKKQWGAIPSPLEWTTYNKTGSIVESENSGSSVRSLAQYAWKHLPLSLANSLGPQIRRYISL